MIRPSNRVILAMPFVALVGLAPRLSFAQATEGTYRGGPLREDVKVDTWQKECGASPSSNTSGGGETVEVSLQGDELRLNGGGRNYVTSACYDQLPTLARETHTRDVLRGQWRTRCTTPASDPRRATVETSVQASGDHIELTETGKYESTIGNGRCSATVTRRKGFDRIRPAAPPPTATEEPKPEPRCAAPGEPARLEVRPAKKAIKVGESFQFRGVVLDAKGCAVPPAPTFKLAEVSEGVDLVLEGSKVTVREGSKEGTAKLLVRGAGREVDVAIVVSSTENYGALLQREGLDPSGEENRAAVSSNAVVGGEIRVEGDGHRRRALFASITGGAAVLLLVAWAVLRRKKKPGPMFEVPPSERAPVTTVEAGTRTEDLVCPTCRLVAPPGATFCPKDGTKVLPRSTVDASGPTAVCPICQKNFGPGVKTCPEHGEALVPRAAQAVLAARPEVKPKTERVCPKCARRFTGNVTFCGHDGTPLVSVN